MVALDAEATAPLRVGVSARQRQLPWALASVVTLLVGIGLRLEIGHADLGDRSAAVLVALLGGGAWIAARLLLSPRAAFLITLTLTAAFVLGALPPRDPPSYDERQALYRTDQVLSVHTVLDGPELTLLVEPTFTRPESRIGIAGTVDTHDLSWDCAFQPGMQRLVLPVPATLRVDPTQALDVRLHLTGNPSRDGDYLVVYVSSAHGFLWPAADGHSQAPSTTVCVMPI